MPATLLLTNTVQCAVCLHHIVKLLFHIHQDSRSLSEEQFHCHIPACIVPRVPSQVQDFLSGLLEFVCSLIQHSIAISSLETVSSSLKLANFLGFWVETLKYSNSNLFLLVITFQQHLILVADLCFACLFALLPVLSVWVKLVYCFNIPLTRSSL